MSTRTIAAARKRANQRLQKNRAKGLLKQQNGSEDRAEACSTIRRTTFVRGQSGKLLSVHFIHGHRDRDIINRYVLADN